MGLTLKERQEAEARERAYYEAALKDSRQRQREMREEKRQKKKPAEQLLGYLLYGDLRAHQLRDMSGYRPRSYNLDKQVFDLLNHLFVRYPVPPFLYPACLDEAKYQDVRRDPFRCMHDIYREWFLTLAQGGSFPKAVKGVMTSKEASAFLRGDPHRLVHENVWLAKLRVAGVPDRLHDPLIDRILSAHYFDDPGGRLADLIRFFARYHDEMGRDTLQGVIDFLAWKLDNDPSFCLKGRTAGSVVRLSNEWHLLIHKAKLGRDVGWDGFGTPDWSLDEGRTLWEGRELRTNKELMDEGSKQRHCVYGYVQRCVGGRCSIFSLRRFTAGVTGVDAAGEPVKQKFSELTRLTVEVASDGSVCQVRGALNRLPTPEERAALNQWAGVNGFTHRERWW